MQTPPTPPHALSLLAAFLLAAPASTQSGCSDGPSLDLLGAGTTGTNGTPRIQSRGVPVLGNNRLGPFVVLSRGSFPQFAGKGATVASSGPVPISSSTNPYGFPVAKDPANPSQFGNTLLVRSKVGSVFASGVPRYLLGDTSADVTDR